MSSIQRLGWLRVLVLALLAVGISAGVAAAQDFVGSFTLPFAVQWEKATLPAGEYSFRISTSSPPYFARVYGKNANFLVMAKAISDASAPAANELIINRSQGKFAVRALSLADRGVVFSYGKSQPRQLARAVEPVLYRRIDVSGK